jgi:hypothetical protein
VDRGDPSVVLNATCICVYVNVIVWFSTYFVCMFWWVPRAADDRREVACVEEEQAACIEGERLSRRGALSRAEEEVAIQCLLAHPDGRGSFT